MQCVRHRLFASSAQPHCHDTYLQHAQLHTAATRLWRWSTRATTTLATFANRSSMAFPYDLLVERSEYGDGHGWRPPRFQDGHCSNVGPRLTRSREQVWHGAPRRGG